MARRSNLKQAAQRAAALPPGVASTITAEFQAITLIDVREDLRTLQRRLRNALQPENPNPITVRGLCDALAKLEEIERRLSGRGLPANVKPERAGRRDAGAMPLGIDLADEPDEPPTPQAPSLPAGLPPPVGVSLPDLSKLGE